MPKIINDPVHGFIELPDYILELVSSPVFQRLRRIKQLGLSSSVYPGAVHSRFHHALGAMHLTREALDVLRRKGTEISKKEYEATLQAILLHDLGHGPFSHSLERHIVRGMQHEEMSLALMQHLNAQHGGKLDLAIEIFTGKYKRHFLHQLISGQLDMDRMDYLIRDSYFTGVAEGVVGLDRIIKTLDVRNDQIVVESKGIYSVEKFIIARRLMYWQVYLHHAALSADLMLGKILQRARELFESDKPIWLDKNLSYFFENNIKTLNDEVIAHFIELDDADVEFHIKKWKGGEDRILAELCGRLLNRKLLKIRLQNASFSKNEIQKKIKSAQEKLNFTKKEIQYFVFSGKVSNLAYQGKSDEPIIIRYKNGKTKDLAEASDIENITTLSKQVTKHYLCWLGA